MTLAPGREAVFRYTVIEADTAAAVGSGDVPVLATPRVLALAERATVAAVAGRLDSGATTVGTRVELDHLAPSPVGADLEVTAVLQRVAGRRLLFAVRLQDGDRPVARGLITRAVVDTAPSSGARERGAHRPRVRGTSPSGTRHEHRPSQGERLSAQARCHETGW